MSLTVVLIELHIYIIKINRYQNKIINYKQTSGK